MMKKGMSAIIIAMLLLVSACSSPPVPDAAPSPSLPSSEERPSATPEAAVRLAEASAVLSREYISFDDLAPEGYRLEACWDAMGIDEDDNVYIGFTSMSPDYREDFCLFMYNRKSGERKFIGTFLQAAEAANNLGTYEEMPKGHTKLVDVDGKIYMASQGFHDFKGSLAGLEEYRGAHIFCYDTATGEFTNVSASLPGGVVIEHEGIVALSYMPSLGLLVGLTHPHSNLVFYDPVKNEVARFAEGIPWHAGAVVSRDMVIDDVNQRVYLCRTTENTTWKDGTIYNQYDMHDEFPVYVYDYQTDTLSDTGYAVKGGIWGASQISTDGNTGYVSSAAGFVIQIDFITGKSEIIGNLLPDIYDGVFQLSYIYMISPSPDNKRFYAIPTYASNRNGNYTGLYEFDLQTGHSKTLSPFPSGVYTGKGVRDSEGYLYFAAFGEHNWSGNCTLLVLEMQYEDYTQVE